MADFPNFFGSTVTHETTAAGAHRIQTVMPFPGAPKDRIVVTTVAADAQVAYVTNKHDVLFEATKYAADDQEELWRGRYDKAYKEMRTGQIMRPFRAGAMDEQAARLRLNELKMSRSEIASLMGQE
jgi:hypothetical protein